MHGRNIALAGCCCAAKYLGSRNRSNTLVMIVSVPPVMVVSFSGFVVIFMAILDLGFRAGSGRSEFVETKKKKVRWLSQGLFWLGSKYWRYGSVICTVRKGRVASGLYLRYQYDCPASNKSGKTKTRSPPSFNGEAESYCKTKKKMQYENRQDFTTDVRNRTFRILTFVCPTCGR
jgi:hypothetical protein